MGFGIFELFQHFHLEKGKKGIFLRRDLGGHGSLYSHFGFLRQDAFKRE
jgi:hypothetical protein